MGEVFAVYRRLAGAKLRADLQYRASFAMFFAGQFLITFLDFVAIAVLFGRVTTLGGWSLYEVAFLYGASGVAFGLSDMFVSQVEYVPERIRLGTFDSMLIRPVSSLLQIVAEDFAPRRMGKVLQAAIIFGVAAAKLRIAWTAGRVAMTVGMVLSGTLIFSAIWIAGGAACFWLLEGQEVMNSVTYGGNFMTQYPIHIYGAWLRRLLAFVTGTAFVAYFPALYILDKPDPLGLPSFMPFLSPVVALVAICLAGLFWRVAIRHYRSTGS
ncbi:MAG: ABC-2 family transporter protein [Actinobacteria bacterium]|nr:ABC-2 family transporter protein [Actinomycetota bacterium]